VKHVFLLCDYDGTLAPIAERPEMADLPESTRQLLQLLVSQRNIQLGIISGRSLVDLKNKVQVGGVIYAGNHGFEIEGPGLSFVNPLANEFKPFFRVIHQLLTFSLRTIKGVFVENKGLTLSVHYRQVEKEDTGYMKHTFERVINQTGAVNKLKIFSGKKVLEIKPAVDWDKGKAINLLIKKYGYTWKPSEVLPLYMGDDLTDEDGFMAVEKYENGISIHVGNDLHRTAASYYLKSPDEVAEFLKMILDSSRQPETEKGKHKISPHKLPGY